MVLGLRSKNKRGTSIQVEHIIHIQEIKPWPPSQSLKSLRSVVLQWENGDQNSGSTSPVIPSLGQGKIEFSESFKLQVNLLKENSGKGSNFLKNVLELNLYETRRDKTMKGQHLGSAVLDMAEHGIVKKAMSFGIPMNCKRSFRNTAQPVLYIKIQPLDKECSSSSSRGSLSKEALLDKDARESVSALMSEEYAEEAEIASFTDDDVSSHSSDNSFSTLKANADSPTQNNPGKLGQHKSLSEDMEGRGEGIVVADIPLEPVPTKVELEPVAVESIPVADSICQDGSLPPSYLVDLSTDSGILNNGGTSLSNSPQRNSTLILARSDASSRLSSLSSVTSECTVDKTRSNSKKGTEISDLHQEVKEKMIDFSSEENVVNKPIKEEDNTNGVLDSESSYFGHQREKQNAMSIAEPKQRVDDKVSQDDSDEVANGHGSEGKIEEVQHHPVEIECQTDGPPDKIPAQFDVSRDEVCIAPVTILEHTPVVEQHRYLNNVLIKPVTSDTTTSDRGVLSGRGNRTLTSDRLKIRRLSMRSPPDLLGSIKHATSDQYMEDVKEIDVLKDIQNHAWKSVINNVGDEQESIRPISDKVKHVHRFNRNSLSNKVQELELRVEMLEGELREAAANEIGLYSIVAEHGSSVHKVHTPARRLSRLYIHASKELSRERKASAARSAVSGLVLAAKACGNDVSRLTYWLSNSVVLRAIVTEENGSSDLPKSAGPSPGPNGFGMEVTQKSSPLKWESNLHKKQRFSFIEDMDDWEDPYTFTSALEKTEAWIFSRIIESVWWQILTPHMQSTSDDGRPKTGSCFKNHGKKPNMGVQKQANQSIDIWKKAIMDAFESLCPVRAGGHECGCLPMLAGLVIEQCASRLDVAMFNAILRESDDELPTDPVSDPISDPKVLPVPPGKSSFGAGAQLKYAIGNLSRWITDLFDMDADDSPRDENDQDDDRLDVAASFKSFHLLNALSDLLMLPKDMLLETSIRKEVCPTFSASIIKRILGSFLPDEFSPDPIPEIVLEALDSEEPLEEDDGIKSFPCSASQIIYSPPTVASIKNIIGDVQSASILRRSGPSVIRKCHTSDDELDELDSPITSIVIEKSSTPIPKSEVNRTANAIRYQLLRNLWKNVD